MPKPPHAPFKLAKARTGRYTLGTVDSALELRAKDPVAWRHLPAQLRRESMEAQKLADEAAARMRELPRLFDETLGRLHPKVRALIDRDQVARDTDLPELLEIPTAVADRLDVPGKPGPHGPWKEESAKAYFEVGRAVEEAIPAFERLIQFRRSIPRTIREDTSRVKRRLAHAGFSSAEIEAGASAKGPRTAARWFVASQKGIEFDAVKRYHIRFLKRRERTPAS